MLVTLPQALHITEHFDFDRFGEIVLSTEAQSAPTAVFDPGPDAMVLAAMNALDRIVLDDGRTVQNPDPAIHPNGGVFDLGNRFRRGDIVMNATGVLDYAFNRYRIQPTQAASYLATNVRPLSPGSVGGKLKVASFNVLNYFTTLGSRGADDAGEFLRQRTKVVAALAGMNADIVGLIQMENNAAAIQDLLAGINAVMGAGTYDQVDTGMIGTDAIRVALIYKPASVSPLGAFAILDSSVDPRFLDALNRPSLAQTFVENAAGGVFTVAVNHLKSKGSDCNDVGDPDTGDGQENCNLTRTAAARAVVDWLATDPTSSNDPDFLIIGDLNSYDHEDPIHALEAGPDDVPGTADDYTDLIRLFQGEFAYSFVIDGQQGYIDYALASASLTGQITGATEWHINADEPDLLDYDTTFKQPPQDALYEANAFRSSSHDPVIVGLDICDEVPPTLDVSVQPAILWPPNHKYVDVAATVVAFDNADPSPTISLVSVVSNEPDNGTGDGDTPNDIVILGDFSFQLRAERSGTGTGRTYTLTYKATDDCGNETYATATVFVPLSKGGH